MALQLSEPRVGLVLGAGGVLGGAWIAGGLAAITRNTGWDPCSATHVVGTSAGSIFAALTAAHVPAGRLVPPRLAPMAGTVAPDEWLLDELAADLKDGRWRPLPARRVFIPKPGRPTEQRPLSIPAVRDRVVQAAVRTVIEPIFEADVLECSFGFRPRRSAHDALQVLVDEAWRGRRWIAESDIANCFEAIPHSGLMTAVEERISDRHVLKLLRAMLRAGVMQDGADFSHLDDKTYR